MARLSFSAEIDVASLALLLPLLRRYETSQSPKIQSATVISTQGKSSDPLLVSLMDDLPLIKIVLFDPIPTARSITASSLWKLSLDLVEKVNLKQ